MNTQKRIELIAEACAHPVAVEFFGEVSASMLTNWAVAELGNVKILDEFCPHGNLLSRAYAPETILHVVSGNAPHAAFQSLLRGLVVGAENIIKLPSSGLPELEAWIQTFTPRLQSSVTCHPELKEEYMESDVIIAIGSDETIAALHQQSRPNQKFIAHGHKVSIGIVTDDYPNAARLAAQDCSLYNQRGCLSPHAIYVVTDPHEFAALMAEEMAKFTANHPPLPLSLSEAGAVKNLRQTTQFIAANDPKTQIWQSPDNLDWTVISEKDVTLKLSCLNRCVYIKPLPADINIESLGPESQYLSSIALHPFSQQSAASYMHLPAHRICPLGQSQQPDLFWHHDGFAPLASLVTWKDLG